MAIVRILKILSQKVKCPFLCILSSCYGAFHKFTRTALIRDELTKLLRFDKSIRFCNDAKAAIIGEANYGAGQDFDHVIGITLGTGLGAGFIVNGFSVYAGQGIPPNAELFPLEFNRKRADDFFSTRGLIKRFQKSGFYYSNVAEVTKDIKQGNAFPIKVFREFGEDLGQFLRPFVYDFTADVLIVLGGIANALVSCQHKNIG